MLNKYTYYDKLGVNPSVVQYVEQCEHAITSTFSKIDDIAEYNQLKVLHAMQENRLSDIHFNWNTGYGYDDIGRDAVENVYKMVFGTDGYGPARQITDRSDVGISHHYTSVHPFYSYGHIKIVKGGLNVP